MLPNLDRAFAALTLAVVGVIGTTANVSLGWAGGTIGAAILVGYAAVLAAVTVAPGSPRAHAAAAAGGALFWSGRVWALAAAHLDGAGDYRTAASIHVLVLVLLMGHHYRANRRIGLLRGLN